MSQENVEIVRRIYDAVARRDDETPFEFYAEDIVWDLSNSGRSFLSSQPIYYGHDGVRQAWRDGLSAFDELTMRLRSWSTRATELWQSSTSEKQVAPAVCRLTPTTWRSGRWPMARWVGCRS